MLQSFNQNLFFQVAKYCSQDQIEMFSDLLQRTLDIQVEILKFEIKI